jgi:hypothetical protein
MTNVKLSAAELALACNADILLTKNSIINKVYELFGHLSEVYNTKIEACDIAGEVKKKSPKISKGENYQGLPWVMLDYPRYFSGNNIFSIRTMFWWGNHFSFFILLKGAYLPANIAKRIIEITDTDDWYLCTATDPWEHHFEEDNMIPVKQLTQPEAESIITQNSFLKLGTKIPIERWESVENFMEENFIKMIHLLNAS